MKHDKELVRRRFARNLGTYNTLADVQRRIAQRLAGRIAEYIKSPVERVVEIGAGTGFLTRTLLETIGGAGQWLINDLVPQSEQFLPRDPRITFVAGDGEALELPAGVDLVASASAVQWFDDLPGFIARTASALSPRGVLALSTFGPENCREITATTGSGLEYYPLGQMAQELRRNGLDVIHLEEWTEQLWFARPIEVLHHLRRTGVNALSAEPWGPGRLGQFEQEYRARYWEPERQGVSLTFHPMIYIATKKQSQQP